MKITHIWSVLCKESVINQDDNLLSMFGVLEELKVGISLDKDKTSIPQITIPINYEIVSLWVRENKEGSEIADLEFRLFDPGKKELSKIVQRIEFPTNVKRFRSRMKVQGLPITKEGEYIFKLSIKEQNANKFELVAMLPLDVSLNYESFSTSNIV